MMSEETREAWNNFGKLLNQDLNDISCIVWDKKPYNKVIHKTYKKINKAISKMLKEALKYE